MTETPRRRRRWPWILLAALLGVPLLGVAMAALLLDAEALRPRLVAAVEQRSGRSLQVGSMRLALSLVPTLELRDVALANAAGGSRPQMLTAKRVEVRAALLPLLSRRFEIAQVVLEEPDLLLEVDAAGRGNWQFAAAPPATPPPAPSGSAAARQPMAFAIGSLRVLRGRIGWRDARNGRTEALEITTLEAAAPTAGPVTAQARLVLRGQPVTLGLEGGGLAAFGGAEPWPIVATLAVAGAEARVQGTLAAGGAWTAGVEARAPDLSRLAPLLPDMPLPPLREVAAAGRASGTGAALAGLAGLSLSIGDSDLSLLRPGLRLRRARVTAAGPDAPILLEAEAITGAEPVRLTGRIGPPARLFGAASGPLAVDLRIETAGAWLTLLGAIAEPRAMAGVDLALAAEAGDLATLSPLAGVALPALTDLKLAGHLGERMPGFAGGAHLRGLVLTAAAGALRGDLTLALGERPGLAGRLASPRLDLDAVLAAQRGPAAPPAPASAEAAPATPPRPPLPAAAGGPPRVIPDLPLSLLALRRADADLRLDIAELTAGGQTWREVVAHLRLEGGQGRIAPFSAATPAGPLSLELAADMRGEVPSLHLIARSPGIDLAAVARAAGAVPMVSGRVQLDADLRGQGADLRAVAGSLSGHLGLALVDGELSRAALRSLPQALLEALMPGGPPGGDIPLRCVALRAPAEAGVLRMAMLYAEGGLGKVGGSGAVDLGAETLALRLSTDLRAGRVAVRAPVTLSGRWTAIRYGVDAGAAAAAGLGAFLAQQRTPDRSLQALAEALGGGRQPGSALPDCTTALAAARAGAPGPAPRTPEAAPPAEPTPGAPPGFPGNAGDLLRGLLRR